MRTCTTTLPSRLRCSLSPRLPSFAFPPPPGCRTTWPSLVHFIWTPRFTSLLPPHPTHPLPRLPTPSLPQDFGFTTHVGTEQDPGGAAGQNLFAGHQRSIAYVQVARLSPTPALPGHTTSCTSTQIHTHAQSLSRSLALALSRSCSCSVSLSLSRPSQMPFSFPAPWLLSQR